MTNAKSKTFIISTIVTAILVAVVFSIPAIIAMFDKDEVTHIGIIDDSGDILGSLLLWNEEMASTNFEMQSYSSETEALEALENNEIEGFLHIDTILDGHINATYTANNVQFFANEFEQALNQIQFRLKAEMMGLSEQEAALLFAPSQMERIGLEETKSEEEIVQSTVLVYLLLFAIYFSVLMYGNMVGMEVAKEKSSRVMEILVSSVNPIYQMFGKILGIALLGLCQLGIFILVGYITLTVGDQTVHLGDLTIDFSDLPASTIIYAVIFYLLGYLLFATIAAMLGSLVSRAEELQTMMTPLTIVVVIGFMLAMFGLMQPNATFVVITSYIPFFAPMIMFLRVGVADPATWETLLSIGLLVATIFIMAWLAAKVYRGGVFMYGKEAKLKDIFKAAAMHKQGKKS